MLESRITFAINALENMIENNLKESHMGYSRKSSHSLSNPTLVGEENETFLIRV